MWAEMDKDGTLIVGANSGVEAYALKMYTVEYNRVGVNTEKLIIDTNISIKADEDA